MLGVEPKLIGAIGTEKRHPCNFFPTREGSIWSM
jgi:hypothetical protein